MEYPRLTAAFNRLKQLLDTRLFIIEDASTVQSVISKCRHIQAKAGGLDLVIVDYLQLLDPEVARRANDRREREVAGDSRKLKRAATSMKFVTLAISQLNDEGLVRESRAIEHDSDCHIKVMSDEDGNPDTDKDIQIVKQRGGVRNIAVPVTFEGQYMRFSPRVRLPVAK